MEYSVKSWAGRGSSAVGEGERLVRRTDCRKRAGMEAKGMERK